MNDLNELISLTQKRDLKLVRLFLKKHPYFLQFDIPHGWPILHRCLANRCIDIDLVKLYINNGGDVNRKTNSGVSLAFLAATMADDRIWKFLASCGGRMSAFETALVAIATDLDDDRANATVVELLKENSELVRKRGDNGFTLLHHAIADSRYLIVNSLLKHGADVNAITWTSRSPLGLCGERTDNEGMTCFETLIAKGAVYTEVEILIKMVRDGDNDQLIKKLRSNRKLINTALAAPFGTLLHIAVWLGNSVNLVEFLLKCGANVNALNEDGETALHRVIHRTSERRSITFDLIRLLLQHGADINSRDERGYTPLHEAASKPWEEQVKLLVDLGAAINAKTNEGETALDLVYSMRFFGGQSLAHWLKTKGAVSGKPKRKSESG